MDIIITNNLQIATGLVVRRDELNRFEIEKLAISSIETLEFIVNIFVQSEAEKEDLKNRIFGLKQDIRFQILNDKLSNY